MQNAHSAKATPPVAKISQLFCMMKPPRARIEASPAVGAAGAMRSWVRRFAPALPGQRWRDMLAGPSCGLHRIERLMRCRFSRRVRDGLTAARSKWAGRSPPSLPNGSTARRDRSPRRKKNGLPWGEAVGLCQLAARFNSPGRNPIGFLCVAFATRPIDLQGQSPEAAMLQGSELQLTRNRRKERTRRRMSPSPQSCLDPWLHPATLSP
jgi:hypothetical protein